MTKAEDQAPLIFVKILPHLNLAIGHRPGRRLVKLLANSNTSAIVTLQSTKEDAEIIGVQAKKNGMQWLWVNIGTGRVPQGNLEIESFLSGVRMIKSYFMESDTENSIYVHCSAGIHRTGMYTLSLLKSLGLNDDQAMASLKAARPLTMDAMGQDRTEFALTHYP